MIIKWTSLIVTNMCCKEAQCSFEVRLYSNWEAYSKLELIFSLLLLRSMLSS